MAVVSALDLECQHAKASVNGAGSISLWVNHSLEAHLNGTGIIRYKGNPSVKDIHNQGYGFVSEIQ